MTVGTDCPRCGESLQAGLRACPRCGFDVSTHQASLPTLVFPLSDSWQPLSQVDALREATRGEYEILAELGRGGMGTVFLAQDTGLHRKVAIKVMAPGRAQMPGIGERFMREARTAGALSHPHIIPIHAVRELDQLLFFVMKFVPGRSLDGVLAERGPLPLPIIRAILAEVGGALDYAHRQGVVHRDVKPANIMVDEEGFAVVTDFGIAKAIEGDVLTQTGTMIGTPAFVAPEVCQGGPATPAADQYALGVVAYQLLTAHLPFTGENHHAVMYAQIHQSPPSILELRPDCPVELSEAVFRMLAKKPEDRWPSLKEAAAAILAAGPPIDESVREEVSALARERPEPEPLPAPARVSAPSGRITGGQPISPLSTPLPGPRVHPAWYVAIGAIGTVLLVLLGPWRTQSGVPADSAGVEAPTADSLWLDARAHATYAREAAITGGVAKQDLTTPDSLKSVAEEEAAAGNKAEAAVLVAQAAGIYTSALEAARKQATATTDSVPPAAPETLAVDSAPVVTPPVVPRVPLPTKPLSDSQSVVAFYSELAELIRARQLGEVKRLNTNISEAEETRWRRLFEDRSIDALDAHFTVVAVTRRGDNVYARVVQQLVITKKGKPDTKTEEQSVILTRGPQGWRQIGVEKE